jgi:hypothetical protein
MPGVDKADANAYAIIADRIAPRTFTREARSRLDGPKLQRVEQYRKQILARLREACPTDEIANEAVTKFRDLAEHLQHTQAVVIVTGGQDVSDEDGYGLRDAWRSLLNDDAAYGGRFVRCPEQLAAEPSMLQGLFHPLLIALLAYRMGGAVNAVLTTQARQWKLPEQSQSEDGLENFHTEGNEDDFLSGHRMALVWEERDGKTRGVSGTHHVFRGSEGFQSHALETIGHLDEAEAVLPMTMIYDSKNATIMYQCLEKDAVRHSISLDFSLVAPDDEVNLLSNRSEVVHLEPTLGGLLVDFPTSRYYHYFHKLLFEDDSVHAIVRKLCCLKVSKFTGSASQNEDTLLRRCELYSQDNTAMIPPDILNLADDVSLSCRIYPSALYRSALILKARRDVHLTLGADLIPQDAIEDNRECARKYIRNMPGVEVEKRLERYAQDLSNTSHSYGDLIPTKVLQSMATTIELGAVEATANGFIDKTCVLISLPSFVVALGQALNGPKAAHMEPTPQIDGLDLQIYRTRCLYLFWCADWLLEYLRTAKQGLCPMEVEAVCMAYVLKTLKLMASKLLRNWVAWGMFVETISGA